jgi:hypothetical protein
MRLPVLLISLLYPYVLLTSCNPPNSQSSSTPKSSTSLLPTASDPLADTPPTSLGVAKKSCGDALPKDEKAYPVKFYPVSISYSAKNLELVRKHFCEDAIKKNSQKLNQDIIQVGAFDSPEKAEKFRLALSVHFQGAEVGEVKSIQGPSTASGKGNIGASAKLTPQQVSELEKIVGTGKDFETQDVVVLPSQLPDGFKVKFLSVSRQNHPSPKYQGGRYSIRYENDKGQCFTLNGGVSAPTGDAPIDYKTTKTIDSPALGSLTLGIDRYDNSMSLIAIVPAMGTIRGRNRYSLVSSTRSDCSRITVADAITIVKSLQFLNP